MDSDGSISYWIDQLKNGNRAAAQKLWESYFQRLVGLARKKLRRSSLADEEDVALSAFKSFCLAAERGRFPRLEDRDDLWQLLVLLTARKAVNCIRYESRTKRGGKALGERRGRAALDEIITREPSADFAVQVADECRHLLDRLDDAELRTVALWKMEGFSNDEIAAKLGCVGRTVERKLRLIRQVWEKELARWTPPSA